MAVIYHSVTGNTKNMGDLIVKGMNSIKGVEAKGFLSKLWMQIL